MLRLGASSLIVLAVGACTATAAPTPVPGTLIAGVHAVCDPLPSPPNPLACSAAVGAALPASGYTTTDLDFVEFHYGSYCAPGVPCASAFPNDGYVVVHPSRAGGARPIVLVQLSADATGRVSVDYSRPFPSGAP